MALFAILAGSHSEQAPGGGFVTYDAPPAGSDDEVIIESSLDLVALYGRDRFRRVGKMRMGTPSGRVTPARWKEPPKPKPDTEESVETTTDETEDAGTEPSFGEDITEQFPSATQQNLRVWKRDGKMYVCTEDEPTVPIHDKGLTKSMQVERIVDEYTATHHNPETKE